MGRVWRIFVNHRHLHAFLLCFWLVEPTTTPIKNCSRQCTTKGVNNVLMGAFLLECPIKGGRLSTMGWMVLNFGKGGSIEDSGFGVSFVQICDWYTFFCLMRPMILPGIFESGKKLIWTPYLQCQSPSRLVIVVVTRKVCPQVLVSSYVNHVTADASQIVLHAFLV
jgi:hypothetical protein